MEVKMYRNKNLNREKIVQTIKDFCALKCNEYKVSDFSDKGSTRMRIDIFLNNESFYIDFHFCADGTTSIQISGGNTQYAKIKEEIADFILASPDCVIGNSDENSKHFVVENISIDDFHAIVDILKTSGYCSGIVSDKKTLVSEMYQFKGTYNEPMTIFYYPTKNKVMIQGKPLLLFYETLACLTELIDLDKIPEVYRDNYNIQIDKNDIENQYELYLQNSHSKHSINLKKFLCQSIYNLSIDGDMFDYTFLAFPVLKALEGHLKIALHNCNVECDKNGNFIMFKPDIFSGKYYLDAQYHPSIGNNTKIKHFEDAYNLFHSQRHGLFHWGNPALPKDQTRVIGNIGTAKILIKETLELIDSYYKI